MIPRPRESIAHLKAFTALALALALGSLFSGCPGGPGIPADEIPGDPPKICTLGADDTPPTNLSQTGIFSDLASLKTINGFHEYEVISPLWSDDTGKHRWMWIPKDTQIGFSPDGAWDFPTGTCFVKEFDLDLTPAATNKNTMRLETRVLIKTPTKWVAYTYQWSDDQSDATLLTTGGMKIVQITDPSAPGGVRTQTWTFPSQADCMTCHNAVVGGPIGPVTAQLNTEHAYADGKENQLNHWNDQGLFKATLEDASKYEAYVNPADTSKSVKDRARTYLATNCAHCHQPNGPAWAQGVDLRYHTADADMGVINVAAQRGSFGLPDGKLVLPGKKEQSVLWLRMLSTDSFRMPAIGTSVVDPVGVAVVGDWIDQLVSP
jgi:uncharacterized repeat protein (TIGR03806 family)